MNPKTLEAALAIGVQLTQAALDWNTRLAAGTISEADIDAKLAEIAVTRQDLVDAIAELKAKEAAAAAAKP